MASQSWYRGRVKAVLSGDCLIIQALRPNSTGVPSERVLTLSSIRAPKLAGKNGSVDEPFAWDSRGFLRKLCLGEEVVYCIDSMVEPFGFVGSVFLGNNNVAALVVQHGWASVTCTTTPYYAELQFYMDNAFNKGLGLWSKAPGAAEASIRTLPPQLNAETIETFLAANKGKSIEAIVELVFDGSTVLAHLLPEFQLVPLIVIGVQSPYVGPNAYPFALEGKLFTESCVLNRDVRIVLEGVDKFSRLIGSVYYYPDEDSEMNLGMELVENGYAKFVPWSAKFMDEDAKKRLKTAELEAKKNNRRIWTDFVLPATISMPIDDQDFTGTVVEVVSGECVIVAGDSGERRVNLSSVWCPKMRNPRRGDEPAPYAREAKEFLRTRLIGRQVNVQMEYSRNVGQADSESSRVIEFGSVFVEDENVAELLVASGLGTVIKHKEFDERSRYYKPLLAAERSAIAENKGVHSPNEAPVVHMTDLTRATPEEAKQVLPSLQRTRRVSAVVEYVFSGHSFKLYIPKETCSISFCLSCVRCPRRNEPYSEEGLVVMRRRLMQREVEIEVDGSHTTDGKETFVGSLWESGTNVSIALVEAGLAEFKIPFGGSNKVQDGYLLERGMKDAQSKRLKMWENFNKPKEELKVVITEVMGSGRFYVQTVGDEESVSMQQQVASLNLEEAPNDFNPRKGDIVLAQFSGDNSWNRARIVNVRKDKFEVFYIDYGNQEVVPYSKLRHLDPSVAAAPVLAQLCILAHVDVPSGEEEFGQEAGEYLTECTLNKEFTAIIEGRDFSGGKFAKGRGTGPCLRVTLVASDIDDSINAAMLRNGLAVTKRSTLREFQQEAETFRRGMWHEYYESDHHEKKAPARKAAGRQ